MRSLEEKHVTESGLRQRVLLEEPVCVGWPETRPPHGTQRIDTTVVVNKVPISQGGADARDNLQALCGSCAAAKHKYDNRDNWRKNR
jgi:5-methylcytosine-specific restriction endonuclease McrA